MNRERKRRLRCCYCIFSYLSVSGDLHCEQSPNYILDPHTRRPDWCPLRKKSREITDDQLRWTTNKEIIVPTESSTDIQVNINDFIPEVARAEHGMVESEET